MAELTTLKHARGRVKAKLTRFSSWLETFDVNAGDFANLGARLHEARSTLAEFDAHQTEIEAIDQVSNHEAERLDFEDTYYATIAKANTYLNRHSSATPISVNSAATANTNIDAISSGIKLPTMNLPKFNGSYDQWLAFRDTFSALIHNNPAISDIQKFFYLRSSLQETAIEVIDSLATSADNYKTAWEMLTKRFDNKKLMINRHLQSLIDTPLVQRESGTALRKMLDHVQKVSRSLKILEANTWDALFTYHIVTKMDIATKREWKSYTKDIDMPTEANLIELLEERCEIVHIEAVTKNVNKLNTSSDSRKSSFKRPNTSFTGVSTDAAKCKLCENSHELFKCPVFRNLSVASRTVEVKKHKLCMNCLRSHSGKCTFGRCRKCQKFHNSLLHAESNPTASNEKDFCAPTPDSEQQASASHNAKTGPSDGPSTAQTTAPFTGAVGAAESQVLLSTALVLVEDKYGKPHECRALLDSGSQSNLMTRELSDRLSLPKEKLSMPLGGINNTLTNVRDRLQLTIRSRQHAYKNTLPVLVIDEIVTEHPTTWFDAKQLRIPENLTLADPTFNHPGKIDLLIGASIFWELICVGQIKLANGQPVMQKTQLGWIISGEVALEQQNKHRTQQFCGFVTNEQLNHRLDRFWTLEECIRKPHFTPYERYCEEHFDHTHGHEDDGKFIVQLPLREDASHLGDSKQTAIKRFHAVERKLSREPNLRARYVKFMDEYESESFGRDQQ